MKERTYIALKLIRKHTIPLLLLMMALVLFFMNFNRLVAYAQEQVASIDYSVCVVEGESVENVYNDHMVVSNAESTEISFDDVSVKLNSKSKLEFVYDIKNLSNENCELDLILNASELINFKVEIFADDESFGETTTLRYVIESNDLVKIKVVLSICNIAKNASMSGSMSLTMVTIGGVNG